MLSEIILVNSMKNKLSIIMESLSKKSKSFFKAKNVDYYRTSGRYTNINKQYVYVLKITDIYKKNYVLFYIILTLEFVLLYDFIFKRELLFFHGQRTFTQAKKFSSSRKFCPSKDFSFIKEVFHKPRFFLDQGNFP